MSVRALMQPRHDCSSCGTCCHNVVVRFVDAEERDRITAIARELGLADGVDGEKIVKDGAVCPFLEDGWKCRIHARFGMEAKPLICRSFPLVVTETESGPRIGIDPASRAFRTTRHTGSPLQHIGLPPNEQAVPAPQAHFEQFAVGIATTEGATLGDLAGVLCGQRGHRGPAFPDGLEARIARRLVEMDFVAHLANEDISLHMQAALGPLARWVAEADPDTATVALGPDEDAYARDAIAAMLYLRLAGKSYPSPAAAGFVALMGAMACAFPGPTPEGYGVALSAWLRMMRAPAFWMPLTPTAEDLVHLATGTRPPGAPPT